MTVTPSAKVYVFGGVMLVSLAVCSRTFNSLGQLSFMVPLGVAAAAYLLAMRELLRARRLSTRVVWVGLLLAAAWQVLFLVRPPGPDDDIHRYVWDGRVQRLGYNPYVLIPASPESNYLHTAETRTMNNPWLPTIYPPGAELFFRAVTAMSETTFAMKVAFVVCGFALVALLLDLLRLRGEPAHWVLAFAWNPLLATEVAGSGHVDIVGALLLVVSVVALHRRMRTIAALAFGIAVAVKVLPIVLVPLYWKRLRVRDGLLALFVVALLYVPFLNHGRIPTGSLGSYIGYFRFNGPVFGILEQLVAPKILAGLAAIMGVAIAFYCRSRSQALSPDYFAWPMAASLLCAPAAYPWYLIWLLPFVRSFATAPLLIWTVSILPTYLVWQLRRYGHSWSVPRSIIILEYGCVVLAAAVVVVRRRGSSPGDHDGGARASHLG